MQDRAWRQGFEAGRKHRFAELVGLGGVLVLLRRHVHPLVLAVWGVLLAVVLSPVLVVVAAVVTCRRSWREWRSWRRTVALAATWAAGVGLVCLAARIPSPWPLVAIAVSSQARTLPR